MLCGKVISTMAAQKQAQRENMQQYVQSRHKSVTWRKNKEKKHKPWGILHPTYSYLCTHLVTHILFKHIKVTATSRRTINNHCSGSEIWPQSEIITVAVLTQVDDKGFLDNNEQTDTNHIKATIRHSQTRLIQLHRATWANTLLDT